MKNNYLISEQEIQFLIKNTENHLKDHTLILVENTKGLTQQRDVSHDLNDFFTNKELGEILDAIVDSHIKFKVYYNEHEFVNDIVNTSLTIDKVIVWNLTRQGSINNKKSLVTSLCDYYKIPFLGSSVYSMNLCRHKYHFSKLLEAHNLCSIPTYSSYSIDDKSLSDWGTYLLKMGHGSSSSNLDSNDIYTLNKSQLQEKMGEVDNLDIICQKIIPGFEVSIPVLSVNGIFKAVGIAGLEIKGEKYLNEEDILTAKHSAENNYAFYDFSAYIDKNYGHDVSFLYEKAVKIATLMDIENYGRIDFRVNWNNEAFCFDIATNPYVTEHSAEFYLYNKMKLSHSDLIKSLLGTMEELIPPVL